MKRKNGDVYVFYKRLEYPEGSAVVRRPVLTEAEQKRRMEELMDAAWRFVVKSEMRIQQKENTQMKGEKKNE